MLMGGYISHLFHSCTVCFFERFHSTRSTLVHDLPLRPMINARMHKWGQLFPKGGQLEWMCSVVDKDICDLLAIEDDHDVLGLVLYL